MTIPTPGLQFETVSIRRGQPPEMETTGAGRGFYNDGTGAPVVDTIEASVQPLPGKEIESAPIADKAADFVQFWTDAAVSAGTDAVEGLPAADADVLLYDSREYKVFAVRGWKMGQLDHQHAKAVATRSN